MSGYDDAVSIHNHSKGSVRCLNCGGQCKLVGAEMVLTGLVRWLFETENWTKVKIPYSVECHLKRIGVDVNVFRKNYCEDKD